MATSQRNQRGCTIYTTCEMHFLGFWTTCSRGGTSSWRFVTVGWALQGLLTWMASRPCAWTILLQTYKSSKCSFPQKGIPAQASRLGIHVHYSLIFCTWLATHGCDVHPMCNLYLCFRTDYWLDRYARAILKTSRLGMRQEVSGSKNKDSTASMNKKSNDVWVTPLNAISFMFITLQYKLLSLHSCFMSTYFVCPCVVVHGSNLPKSCESNSRNFTM